MIRNNKNYQDEIHDMDCAERLAFKSYIIWQDIILNILLIILSLAVLFIGYMAYKKHHHPAVINQEGVTIWNWSEPRIVPVFELREIDKDF